MNIQGDSLQFNNSPETRWEKPTTSFVKPLRPLTRKQEAFVRKLVDNPKISTTQAVRETYNVTTDNSASQIATDNLRKPQVLAALAKYSGNAELAVIEAMKAERKEWKFNPESKQIEYLGSEPDHAIRLRAADSLLDRVHGKATQRIEQQSTSVNISVDLTTAAGEQVV